MECIKVVLLLGLVMSIDARSLMGGKIPLHSHELEAAEAILIHSLAELAYDGPDYRLIRIISVTKPTVAGRRYDYEVELDDGTSPQTCKVEFTRPRLPQGAGFTLNCPDYKTAKTLVSFSEQHDRRHYLYNHALHQ